MTEITDTPSEITHERVYKTPSYTRAASKRYREKNRDKILIQKKIYIKKIQENEDESYYNRIKVYNKQAYKKKKEKGITPEEKANRAKYMREYRAKKKAELLIEN